MSNPYGTSDTSPVSVDRPIRSQSPWTVRSEHPIGSQFLWTVRSEPSTRGLYDPIPDPVDRTIWVQSWNIWLDDQNSIGQWGIASGQGGFGASHNASHHSSHHASHNEITQWHNDITYWHNASQTDIMKSHSDKGLVRSGYRRNHSRLVSTNRTLRCVKL
jgi:hypothetical protein